jgi:hypothetical protein
MFLNCRQNIDKRMAGLAHPVQNVPSHLLSPI